MTTVTWVQNVDGYYHVSSADHLIQIMNKGSVYVSDGSPPSNFFAAKYIQTADIDLLGDSTHIKPIGLNTNSFKGVYNGNNYRISNWVYLDPNFPTNVDCEYAVGLFGRVGSDAIVSNIRMNGLCSLRGFSFAAGFVVGYSASARNVQVMNIDVALEPGSEIDQGDGSTSFSVGGVLGVMWANGGEISNISLRGSLDYPRMYLGASGNTAGHHSKAGGVIGHAADLYISGIQNEATFPSGINANITGGVIGVCIRSSVVNCINAMIGNVTGDRAGGGVVGFIHDTGVDKPVHTLINIMTGDISGDYTGGIVGIYHATDTSHTFINYMSQDIDSTVDSTVVTRRLIRNVRVTTVYYETTNTITVESSSRSPGGVYIEYMGTTMPMARYLELVKNARREPTNTIHVNSISPKGVLLLYGKVS